MTKKIFKSVGLIALAIAVAIGSFFVSISKKDTSYLASADSTTITGITFTSSDIFFARLGTVSALPSSTLDLSNFLSHSGQNQDSPYWVLNWSFELTYDYNASSSVGNLNYYASGIIYKKVSDDYGFGTLGHSSLELSSVEVRAFNNSDFDNNRGSFYTNRNYIPIKVGYSGLTSYQYTGIGTAIYIPDNGLYPSLSITEIEIGNYRDFPFFLDTTLPDYLYYSNIVCYTDTNGFKYFYFIPSWYTYERMPMTYLSYRHYFTGSDMNLSENQIYQQGYNKGLLENQQSIYDNGYNTGYDDGFDNGKITGGAEANDYSFFSLFGAIFDAPVTLFTSLLNFDFLGINLWSFVTALLTLAIILFVIKLFIRR